MTPRWPAQGRGYNRRRRDQRQRSPRIPSPLPDRGYESDRSSMSVVSSVSSQSDHSDYKDALGVVGDIGRELV